MLEEQLPAEEHVLHDVQVVAEGQVLVDRLDAEVGGVPGGVEADRVALPRISPLSGSWMPATALMSTDLPAPLSPASAVT